MFAEEDLLTEIEGVKNLEFTLLWYFFWGVIWEAFGGSFGGIWEVFAMYLEVIGEGKTFEQKTKPPTKKMIYFF